MAISKIVQNSLDTDSISLGPKIRSVQIANSTYVVKDDTAVNTGGGYIVITGSGFTSNSTVLIGANAACSVTYISTTQLRAQIPAATPGSYPVYVVTGDGGTAIRVNALTYSDSPTWVTTSPLTSQSVDTSFSIQLSASGANTYTLQTGSSLPSGVSLAANGLLSGTVTGIENDTTYNFTVEAIDAEAQESPKALAITITGQYVISRSLRFNTADSTYLSRTFSTPTNRRIWTLSFWAKRNNLSSSMQLFGSRPTSSPYALMYFSGTDKFEMDVNGAMGFSTNQVFRDPSAWYHLVVAVDTTQATNSNRIKVYVNGTQITSFATTTYPSLNYDGQFNTATIHTIGKGGEYTSEIYSGYMAEIHFVDGTQLTPSSFGKYDEKTGVWVPKTVSGVTYGTNGFYLPFSDNGSTTTLGNDGTANNNDWTLNNFSVTSGVNNDGLVDSPTPNGTDDGSGADVKGSYAVFNPLSTSLTLSYQTITDGGLKLAGTSVSNSGQAYLTAALPKTGKYYLEFVMTAMGDGYVQIGATEETYMNPDSSGSNYAQPGYAADSTCYQNNGTLKVDNGETLSWGATYTTNDVVGMAIDCDNGAIYFSKNGTWQNSGVPTSGASKTGAAKTWTGGTKIYHIGVAVYKSTHALYVNAGQRPFAYTAPSGFVTINTQNLIPAIAANSSTTLANSYFDVVTYSGTGSELNVTGLNFNPDFVWIKQRNAADVHVLVDKVRGDDGTRMYVLNTDNTQAEATRTESTTAVVKSSSWPSNGFRVGTNGQTNSGSGTYVAWAWKAGDSNVTNNDGSVTGTVRANQTAGFSIVGFATGAAGQKTVGHGLGKTPRFIIMRARENTSYNWSIYHASVIDTTSKFFRFTNENIQTSSTIWGSALPTSSVFGFTSDNGVEANKNAIAYCWAEIEGFSKFGSYVGNGDTNGPFIYTGFRPAFIMIKGVGDSRSWLMLDVRRETYNPVSNYLQANSGLEENGSGGFTWLDITANGFKQRNTGSWHNSSGVTYAYAAFAESPFKHARAR
jgi:hypothetical protein